MLDRIAISGPLAERHGVGVADHRSRFLCDQMRHFAPVHRLAAALEVLGVGRFELVLLDAWIDAAADVMEIDGEHPRHVAVARVAD